MNEHEQFIKEVEQRVKSNGTNNTLIDASKQFMRQTILNKYSYNFSWLGRPIIQYPQDVFAMQEIIWKIKPDLIIETGIAHGGSIIFYASMLELIGKGEVLGIDIDIREHNRKAIEEHFLFKRIKMIQGSSVSNDTYEKIKDIAKDKKTVLVCLDSNHTYEHVLKEIELYSKFVTKGSYLVVFDTIIESVPDDFFKDRPWKTGNNPQTAVTEFLRKTDAFIIDEEIDNKILISVAPGGYLKRIK